MKRVIGKVIRGGDIVSRVGLVLVCLSGWAESSITITPTYVDQGEEDGETWTSDRIAVFEQAIDDWESALGAPLSEGSVHINVTVDFTSGQSYGAQWEVQWSDVSGGASTRPWAKTTHSIHFNRDYFDTSGTNYTWWDSSPTDGSDQPSVAWDALTLSRHELGHMLGVTEGSYVDNAGSWAQADDLWGRHITSGVFNPGGLDVAMDPSSLSHVADSGSTEGDLMVPALVNGERREISETNLQMLILAYDYVHIPEPGWTALGSMAFLVAAGARRRRA